MLQIKRYTTSNPIATKLLAYVLISSTLITLVAIAAQRYSHVEQNMDDLTKRMNQIQASTIPSISKS